MNQVRIVPRASHYVVEVIYTVKPKSSTDNPEWAAGLDPGITPYLVNGRPLKSVNACYNKVRAALQADLPKGQYTSRRITALADRRNRKVKHYLHWASRCIICDHHFRFTILMCSEIELSSFPINR